MNQGGFHESVYRRSINLQSDPYAETGEYLHHEQTRDVPVKVVYARAHPLRTPDLLVRRSWLNISQLVKTVCCVAHPHHSYRAVSLSLGKALRNVVSDE